MPIEYYSEKHRTMISTTLCGQFLVSNNNPSDYQAKEFYTLHRDAIQEIAEGNKLWGETASEKMILFRQYITKKWFIVSSNTKLVERWVKDSNECTISGKDESSSTIIAICRSSTVFEYKLEARDEAERRVLKGNQYITSGKKGERINRKTNQLELRTNKLRNIRGSSYSALVIKKTIIRNEKLESNKNMGHVRSSIRRKLTSKGDQFNTARIDKSVENYAHILLSDAPIPIRNAIQRQRGIDTTTHMCGEVLYSATRIIHIPLIRQELTARGVAFEQSWSIKGLVSLLKDNDTSTQRIALEGNTRETVDDSRINSKSFLPIATTADRYNL